MHTSIDIVEEKLNVGNKAVIDIRDLYLGLLFATEEYKMFVFYNIKKCTKDILISCCIHIVLVYKNKLIELFIFRYGYATNTKIKFVIVLQSSNISLRDNEVKMVMLFCIYFSRTFSYQCNCDSYVLIYQMFKKLHAAYSNAVCNPLYIPGDQLNSK